MSQNKVLVITSYPPKDSHHGKGVSGLASFTKNTIQSIPSDKLNFIVLAEQSGGDKEYYEGSNLIKRIWKRNSLSLYLQLLGQLIKYRKESNRLLLEFEFAIYGSSFITGLMPLFILKSKLLGYKTTLVLHQVLPNVSVLSQHIGIEKGSIKLWILNILTQMYNRALTSVCEKIIVLDQVHKNHLKGITNLNKVTVIPHGVEDRTSKTSSSIPEDHKIRLMYFGYLAWYKGADWLVDSYLKFKNEYPELAKQFKVILAGGESPTQKNNPSYQKYYQDLLNKAKLDNNIEITGFVPEEDLSKVFSNADIQILPYRAIFSSSGPLSFAYAYEKPFLISDKLQPYLETQDIKDALKELHMSDSDITFNLDQPIDMFLRLSKLSATDLKLMSKLSAIVKQERNWESLGKKYAEVLEN